MKNAIQINDVYINGRKKMVPIIKGILSVDTEAAIDLFRKAAEVSDKTVSKPNSSEKTKTCKPK
jgi:dihydrodipicolinate synthase/N-acetylneuraminate lyase